MRIKRRSLKRGTSGLTSRDSAHTESRIDPWLARLSSLSQPLLLCLAVFGYFYTVVPVYQKELLGEQIAAKEIELTRLQRSIDATGPAMRQLESDRTALERQLRLLNSKKGELEFTIAELNSRQSILEARNRNLEASRTRLTEDVATAEASARILSLRAYHDSFSGSVITQYLMGDSDTYKLVDMPTYEAITRYLITPYAAVSSVLAQGDSKFIESSSSIPRHLKDEYHARIRAALESQMDSLSRPQDDVGGLLANIKLEMAGAAIDPTPGDNFNERRFETRTRLVKLLHDSRQREWDRTKNFLKNFAASIAK